MCVSLANFPANLNSACISTNEITLKCKNSACISTNGITLKLNFGKFTFTKCKPFNVNSNKYYYYYTQLKKQKERKKEKKKQQQLQYPKM